MITFFASNILSTVIFLNKTVSLSANIIYVTWINFLCFGVGAKHGSSMRWLNKEAYMICMRCEEINDMF